MQNRSRANHSMAQNPCLKLYGIVKKPQVHSVALADRSGCYRPVRSGMEQFGHDFHFFETVTGTTKLTI